MKERRTTYFRRIADDIIGSRPALIPTMLRAQRAAHGEYESYEDTSMSGQLNGKTIIITLGFILMIERES